MKLKLRYIFFFLSCIVILGCETIPLSQDEKRQLDTLAIAPPTLNGAAHTTIINPVLSEIFLPVYAGNLIIYFTIPEKAVTNADYTKALLDYDKYASRIKNNIPDNLPLLMLEAITESLREDPFFSSRLKEKSENVLHMEIQKFSLVISHINEQNEVLLTPRMTAFVKLVGKEKVIFSKLITSNVIRMYRIQDYACKPKLLGRELQNAIEDIGFRFSILLDEKLGRVPLSWL